MRDALRRELAARIADIHERDALTLVELARDGVVVWTIDRDSAGTPHCYYSEQSWFELDDNDTVDMAGLRQFALAADDAGVVLVCTSPDGPLARQAYRAFEPDPRVISAYECPDSLDKLLIDVLSHDRLTRFYRLVLIERSVHGRPQLTSTKLFDPGARRGESCRVEFWCEPADHWGTTFAVVADGPDLPFRLVSMKSVNLAPGRYTVTADLRGPGQVRFEGLPADFRPEQRLWSEIVASIPGHIQLTPVPHLILLLETSGLAEEVDKRCERAEQLLHEFHSGVASLVVYGPHQVGRLMPGEEPNTLAWEQDAETVLDEVRKLREGPTSTSGYTDASQLECALRDVADRLDRTDGPADRLPHRLVLVTIAARPAFPPRRDVETHIIPCPYKRDWSEEAHRLHGDGGTRFGAILDRLVDARIWRELGKDALVGGDADHGTFDSRAFAVALGLLNAAADSVPLPLLKSTRG